MCYRKKLAAISSRAERRDKPLPGAVSRPEQVSPTAKRTESASPNLFPLLIAVVVYAAARNLVEATIKPFWFDEILTEVVSREPGIAALWRTLKTAVDGNPPLFYLVERTSSHFAANGLIAYRLPSILAFSCTLICLYVFVARRSGPVTAMLCTSLIFLTPLFGFYADEARPYSMSVACIAFAMVCYQRVSRPPWTLGVFFSMLLAACLHYYGVVALSPFLAAELFFTLQTRRLRPSVWGALLLAPTPLVFLRPLLTAMKASYVHFWAQPHLMDALKSYGDFFSLDAPWGFALAGILFLAVLLSILRGRPSLSGPLSGTDEAHGPSLSSEDVLVLVLLVYPFIAFVVAKVMHGGYVLRYVLCTILAIAIAFRYVLEWLGERGKWAAAACLFLAIGTQEFSFWRTLRQNIGTPARFDSGMVTLVDSAHRDDLPLLFADAGEYLEVKYYAPPRLKSRMAVVVDPTSAYLYRGTDTLENIMLSLQRVTPSDVYGFSQYKAAHRSFLLYLNRMGIDWLPGRLIEEGDNLRLVGVQGNRLLFLVQLKPKS